jgi:hypothetical protein
MKHCVVLRFLFLLSVLTKSFSANATPIYGLTTGNLLVRFDSSTPGTIVQVLLVSGLQSGDVLQGIDFRPATGELLGLGNSNRLYIVSTNTGAATPIARRARLHCWGRRSGLM